MKFYIETYGCSRNIADSEAIAGALAQEHGQVSNPAEADIIVVNTCIVKNKTESQVILAIKKYAKTGKKLVVAGCMPAAELEIVKKIAPKAEIWSVKHEDVLEGPRIRANKVIGIIPISSGCLGSCTYCIVRFARGNLKSYPPDKILKAVQNAVAEGCKEIWITSQDNGAYGIDIGTNLPDLLEKICSLNGDFKVRVGMMNPNHTLKILPQLIKILKHEKMFKFLHIPVQSGSNEILKAMNRFYTAEDYRKIISTVKKEIPQITVATDIIAGFPGETDQQFRESLTLIEETEPDIVNISRFSARPGTPASLLKEHSDLVKKVRSREMSALGAKMRLLNNRKWLNWEGPALIDEQKKETDFVARNFAYKPVVVKGRRELGQSINVKIKKATYNSLFSE